MTIILKWWYKNDITAALNIYYNNPNNSRDIANIDVAVNDIFQTILQWRDNAWFADAKREIISSAIRQRFNEHYKVDNLRYLLEDIPTPPKNDAEHEEFSIDLRKRYPQFSIHEIRNIVKQSEILRKSLESRNLVRINDGNYRERVAFWKGFNEDLKREKAISRKEFKRLNRQFSKQSRMSIEDIERKIHSEITNKFDKTLPIEQIRKELDKAHPILCLNVQTTLQNASVENEMEAILKFLKISEQDFINFLEFIYIKSEDLNEEVHQETKLYEYNYMNKKISFAVTPEKEMYLLIPDSDHRMESSREIYNGINLDNRKLVRAFRSKEEGNIVMIGQHWTLNRPN